MSDLTKKKCEELESAKMQAIAGKSAGLGKRVAEADDTQPTPAMNEANKAAMPLRKKRAKAPNPLSMRKPKKARVAQNHGEGASQTIKRKKLTTS
jgi:hypothetical protein